MDKWTSLAIVCLVAVSLMIGLSLSNHNKYIEQTVTIQGQPVEPPEDAPDDVILSQSEMTANEYQFANALMSDELVVDRHPNGTALGVETRSEYTLGGIGNQKTITREQAFEFTEQEYVQIDGHHYQLTVTEERIEPFSYLVLTEILMSIFVAILGLNILARVLNNYVK